jgi:hypothetical protein
VNATPPVEAFGDVVNPILAAVPTVMAKLLLVAVVSVPSAACRV